MKFEIKNNR